jgi:Ca2+-transporting ATPase
MDPPEGDEMRRAPVPRHDALVDRAMLVRVAVMALSAVLVCFGWFAWRLDAGAPIDVVRTEVFTLLAMCQWFNVVNCESATRSALRLGVAGNRWLLAGLAASVLLQATVLYLPPMNALFHTVPLPAATLGPLVALASVVLWAEEARKLVARARSARRRR